MQQILQQILLLEAIGQKILLILFEIRKSKNPRFETTDHTACLIHTHAQLSNNKIL